MAKCLGSTGGIWGEENYALKNRAFVHLNQKKFLFCLNQNSSKCVNDGQCTIFLLPIT